MKKLLLIAVVAVFVFSGCSHNTIGFVVANDNQIGGKQEKQVVPNVEK